MHGHTLIFFSNLENASFAVFFLQFAIIPNSEFIVKLFMRLFKPFFPCIGGSKVILLFTVSIAVTLWKEDLDDVISVSAIPPSSPDTPFPKTLVPSGYVEITIDIRSPFLNF